jgi:hypothetical protein
MRQITTGADVLIKGDLLHLLTTRILLGGELLVGIEVTISLASERVDACRAG